MKKKILLMDPSVTVQKVVALTLDKNRYQLSFARSKAEAQKVIAEGIPHLILVAEQIPEFSALSFPRELESWVGRQGKVPPVLLMAAQSPKESRGYAAVLKKPFTPQVLQGLIEQHALPETEVPQEDPRLEKIFNTTFSNEDQMVRDTFRAEVAGESPTLIDIPLARPEVSLEKPSDLWGANDPMVTAPSEESAPQGGWEDLSLEIPEELSRSGAGDPDAASVTQGVLEANLDPDTLQVMVQEILDRIVPPIVERLVQERLDRLLEDHEGHIKQP